MTTPIRSRSRVTLSGALALFTVSLAGCGGTIAFQGQKAFAVTGNSAPPPAAITAPTRRVNVSGNKITIDEKIQFAHDKALILEASFGLLNEVVQVIKDNTQIKKILIEGHASSEGDHAHNLKLSDDRAKAVLTYLTEHGIAKDRLSSKGFGSSDPIADNNTEEGREKNRRVEFTIVDPPAAPAAGGTKK
jgi:outer membrane protein OmpA-like peptidoglycan-associated protein